MQERRLGGNTGPMSDDVNTPDPGEPDEVEVEAFDLNDDGKISVVEAERARLGVVDARLEEIAEEGGVKGKLAEAAHKVIDKLDND